MTTFVLSVVALVLGYILYGRFVERMVAPDNRPTPATLRADGVDFMVLPGWKVFMVQFLNIAGTGPIFGAIMGAKFGSSAYLWIVLGCIFAGAVHDYLSGMLSMRYGGANLPQLIGLYRGKVVKNIMLVACLGLLVLVDAVFVYSPAVIMAEWGGSVIFWSVIIFLYYLVATIVPIDKIIGRVYPLFAVCLLFMTVVLMVCLFVRMPNIPEIWHGLDNRHPELGPIFPCLFITIACGAISGFHATQSPLMVRCMKSEKMGRPVFYGAMITEGVVALVWAAVASWFFYGGGAADLGCEASADAPVIVSKVARDWLGTVGGMLALIGVVGAPITTGDTAMRSARLIAADFLHLRQHSLRSRLQVSIPLFGITLLLLWFNMSNKEGFSVIWNYFSWLNQSLTVITLWVLTAYLARHGKWLFVTLIPALFMTCVWFTFILVSPVGLGLDPTLSYALGGLITLLSLLWFCAWYRKFKTRRRRYAANLMRRGKRR